MTLGLFILTFALTSAQGIRNAPEHNFNQFQNNFNQGLPGRPLSPQQHANIFNDLQQHRFQIGNHHQNNASPHRTEQHNVPFHASPQFQPEGLTQFGQPNFGRQPAPQAPNFVQAHPQNFPPPPPPPSFSPQHNSNFGPPNVPFSPPPPAFHQQPAFNPQPAFPQKQDFQPQPSVIANFQNNFQPQNFRPTDTLFGAQATFEAPQAARLPEFVRPPHNSPLPPHNSPQPPHNPPPAHNSQFHEGNNFVVPREQPQQVPKTKQQHFQYLQEVTRPKVPFSQELESQTPSYILETQPPTTRKQKPLEAITFSTEPYSEPTQGPPKVVKYRIRPNKQEENSGKKHSEKNPEIYLKNDRQKLYQQLVRTQEPTTPTPPTTTTQSELSLQEELQRQIQEQLGGSDNPFQTLKITLPDSLTPEQIANLPQLAGLSDAYSDVVPSLLNPEDAPQLPQLQVPQIPQLPPNIKIKHLPATKPHKKASKPEVKTIVIHQPTTSTTTVKPPTVLFEELTKGVLPPGADFELIRQGQDGGLEPVGPINSLSQKKVTFVILEEQPDGSVKVQGVRGNGNEEQDASTNGEEVDNIIKKLQKGEIKLPPSNRLKTDHATPEETVATPSYVKHSSKYGVKQTTHRPSVHKDYEVPKRKPSTTPNSHAGPVFAEYTTAQPPTQSTGGFPSRKSSVSFLPTLPTVRYSSVTTEAPTTSTTPEPTTPFPNHYYTTSSQYDYQTTPQPYYPEPSTSYSDSSVPETYTPGPRETRSLADVLRSHSLYAMAKFLRQSGLDTVLNETGPYTIFVPTDKAFRTLLVQLGGPDRAELKFRENPRLLSGLLLHHVIPGSFSVESLQDEMTGVSLAGTQLRVNTYTTQDNEWNDLKVVTINGARVLREKSDITIPEGIAHTVDRVMFPLPVGDIVQTLQADRQSSFSKFLRLLEETGVNTLLSGNKVFTVFAPTDLAFSSTDYDKLLEQRAQARALVMRHIIPGTLYSAGMHYYQLKDTMMSGKQISLFKEAGRVKVNNAHVISRNIPATNGVIHAIDALL